MALRVSKERPQRTQKIIVTARRKLEFVEERGHIIRRNGVHVAVKRFFEYSEPVTEIGEINGTHAFARLGVDHLIDSYGDALALHSLAMVPGVEARCIQQRNTIKKFSGLAVFDCDSI